jgi:hypothetical protein
VYCVKEDGLHLADPLVGAKRTSLIPLISMSAHDLKQTLQLSTNAAYPIL